MLTRKMFLNFRFVSVCQCKVRVQNNKFFYQQDHFAKIFKHGLQSETSFR